MLVCERRGGAASDKGLLWFPLLFHVPLHRPHLQRSVWSAGRKRRTCAGKFLQIVAASGLPYSIVRTALVYGVTHDQVRTNIVLWVKQSLEQGKVIRVVNDQWRTPTLAEDLAVGCWSAASLRATGIYHVSGDDLLSPYQMALRTAEHFQLDASLIRPVDSEALRQAARRPPRTGFIIEKARRELGYQPHNFAEGLKIVAQQLQ